MHPDGVIHSQPSSTPLQIQRQPLQFDAHNYYLKLSVVGKLNYLFSCTLVKSHLHVLLNVKRAGI